VAKDVVGLLLGEVIGTKNHTLLQRMWFAYHLEILRIIDSLTKMKTY
jgi:hypothetical protein